MFSHFVKTAHRHELERYLRRLATDVSGDILDAGAGARRYDHLFRGTVTAIDVVPNPERNVLKADVNALPFPDARFDAVLAIELFEYLTTPERAISEIRRVLKDGGTVLLSAPLMYRFHGDVLRYTERYFREVLFRSFHDVKVMRIGNYASILWDLFLVKAHKIRPRLPRYLAYLALTPLLLLRPVAERFAHDPEIVSGYLVRARK